MFCKTVSKSHDLDKEIQEAFDFINGEIVSYDEPYGSSGGASFEDGEKIRQSLQGRIENVKTNKGDTYKLLFESHSIYKENKDKIGVMSIIIIDNDSVNKYQLGKFIE